MRAQTNCRFILDKRYFKMEIEMRIKNGELMADVETGAPIVALESVEDSSKGLAFYPAEPDAHSIFAELIKISPLRPMTHDLFKSALDMLKVTVEKVVITDIKNNIYHAAVFLRAGEDLIWLDSRPSDAISMAVRCDAKIYADDKLLVPLNKLSVPALPAPAQKPPDEDTEIITSADKSADLSKMDTKKMPRA